METQTTHRVVEEEAEKTHSEERASAEKTYIDLRHHKFNVNDF